VNKTIPYFLLCASIIACIGGVALFTLLFTPDFNIYWLILSPIIFALYQAPAAYLFRLYRKTKRKAQKSQKDNEKKDEEG
jgi:membrane protein implicated in regulation of membrane protease activity